MGLSPCWKFVIDRTLTILSCVNSVTVFFRNSKKLGIALAGHYAAILSIHLWVYEFYGWELVF